VKPHRGVTSGGRGDLKKKMESQVQGEDLRGGLEGVGREIKM